MHDFNAHYSSSLNGYDTRTVATCGVLLPRSVFIKVFPACQRSMSAWLVFKLYGQADTWLLRLGTDSATLEHKRAGHKSFASFSFYHHSITTKDQYMHMCTMAQC